MNTKHLLPCSCGEKLTVDVSQGGQTLVCTCGRQVEAPPMRAIRQLELAPSIDEAVDAERASSWSLRQGLPFVVGVLAIVIALGAAGVLFSERLELDTTDPLPEAGAVVDERIETMPIDEMYDLWTRMIQQGLSQQVLPAHVHDRRRYEELTRNIYILLAVAACGVCIAAGSALWRPRKPKESAAT